MNHHQIRPHSRRALAKLAGVMVAASAVVVAPAAIASAAPDDNYPPAAETPPPPPASEDVSPPPPSADQEVASAGAAGELPRTGGGPDATLMVAGASLLVGLGFVAASRPRSKPRAQV
jgi:LPXTG-motif cell wall-anchored protein